MTSVNTDERAYSASTCAGLMSPDMMANMWMSSLRNVRSRVAVSPTSISSKVRFSIQSESGSVKWFMNSPLSGYFGAVGKGASPG
jgi:hypothetical protein